MTILKMNNAIEYSFKSNNNAIHILKMKSKNAVNILKMNNAIHILKMKIELYILMNIAATFNQESEYQKFSKDLIELKLMKGGFCVWRSV